MKPLQTVILQDSLTQAWEIWTSKKVLNPKIKQKINVLIVDDEPLIQLVHTKFLEELNCSVEAVNEGNQALKLLNNKYDIIFIDMGLPGLSGVEVVKAYRANEQGPERLPIIALTGYNSTKDKQAFIEAGVDDLLIKPVTHADLQKILDKYALRN